MAHPKDITGRRFGKLLAVENTGRQNKNQQYIWRFQCDCGNTIEASGTRVKTGHRSSCGCLIGQGRRVYEQRTLTTEYIKHKTRAREYGRSYLTREQWGDIVSKPCFYCGGMDRRTRPPKSVHMTAEELGRYETDLNGVDRIDSSIGYLPENVVPCCGLCNWMKGDQTQAEFFKRVAEIYKRHA